MSYKPKNMPVVEPVGVGIQLQPLMRNVYMWMGLGLLATALVAIFLPESIKFQVIANPVLLFGVIGAELILVLALSWGINRLNPNLAAVMFFVYAVLNGVSLSFIFLVYDLGSIVAAFLTTAVMFGVMTVFAMTTSIDLTKYRSFFMMGLVGLIAAVFINILIGSQMIDFVISIVGVLLFTGLTAYDTQRIAAMAAQPEMQTYNDRMFRMSILGALRLYLDFINLFIFLLRLLGSRR